ncbi:hypothetical protein D3C86_1456080 [compost metagenome]
MPLGPGALRIGALGALVGAGGRVRPLGAKRGVPGADEVAHGVLLWSRGANAVGAETREERFRFPGVLDLFPGSGRLT